MPFGCLLGDFGAHFRGLWGFAGWHSLSSENHYFHVLEVPGRHFFVQFSRSGSRVCFLSFFMWFSVIWEPFGLPFGSLWASFSCGICVVFRIGGKVASGVPKEALLSDFRYHFGGF